MKFNTPKQALLVQILGVADHHGASNEDAWPAEELASRYGGAFREGYTVVLTDANYNNYTLEQVGQIYQMMQAGVLRDSVISVLGIPNDTWRQIEINVRNVKSAREVLAAAA